MGVLFGLVVFLVSILHLGIVLLLAPWVMGFEKWLEAKIQGVPSVPFRFYWAEIYSVNVKKLSSFLMNSYSYTSFLSFMGLGIVIIAALLVPTFSVGMIIGSVSDFLLITGLLLVIPIIFFFISLKHVSLLSAKNLQKILIETLLFTPVLFFIFIIIRFITGSTLLDEIVSFFHHAQDLPVMALCPLFIGACSLFFFIWEMPDFSNREGMDGFGGTDRGLLLYINDVQFLIWLSLIAFLMWPQSVSILDNYGNNFSFWFKAMPFSFLAWVAKIIIECFILAIMRSLTLSSNGMYRIGIAIVLSLVAVIIYFAGLSGE